MEAAAKELKSLGAVPFAAYCTDPCDGRTQGTTGMFDFRCPIATMPPASSAA